MKVALDMFDIHSVSTLIRYFAAISNFQYNNAAKLLHENIMIFVDNDAIIKF